MLFRCLISRLEIKLENYFVSQKLRLENYVTSVSHNVLYYQPLPIAHLPCNVFNYTLGGFRGWCQSMTLLFKNRNKKVTWSNSHEVIKLLQRKCTLQEKRFDCECLSYVSYVVQWWISLFTQSPDSRPYCELFFSIIFVSFNHESILHYSGYFSPSKRRDKKDRELYEGKTTAIYH